eukprot:14995759-Alexandrium_andersonii.AAC.1
MSLYKVSPGGLGFVQRAWSRLCALRPTASAKQAAECAASAGGDISKRGAGSWLWIGLYRTRPSQRSGCC